MTAASFICFLLLAFSLESKERSESLESYKRIDWRSKKETLKKTQLSIPPFQVNKKVLAIKHNHFQLWENVPKSFVRCNWLCTFILRECAIWVWNVNDEMCGWDVFNEMYTLWVRMINNWFPRRVWFNVRSAMTLSSLHEPSSSYHVGQY